MFHAALAEGRLRREEHEVKEGRASGRALVRARGIHVALPRAGPRLVSARGIHIDAPRAGRVGVFHAALAQGRRREGREVKRTEEEEATTAVAVVLLLNPIAVQAETPPCITPIARPPVQCPPHERLHFERVLRPPPHPDRRHADRGSCTSGTTWARSSTGVELQDDARVLLHHRQHARVHDAGRQARRDPRGSPRDRARLPRDGHRSGARRDLPPDRGAGDRRADVPLRDAAAVQPRDAEPDAQGRDRVKGLGETYSFGFPLYAVGQTADILAFRPSWCRSARIRCRTSS